MIFKVYGHHVIHHFSKESSFYDLLLAFLNRRLSKMKYLLKEIICSKRSKFFKVLTPFKKESKMKIAELVTLKGTLSP